MVRHRLSVVSTGVVVALAAVPGSAGTATPTALAACKIGGTLRAPTHHPKAGRKWPIVVTETPRGLRTSARYDFLFQGQKVSTQYPFYNKHYHFKTRFRDGTIVWPKRSVGFPLTFRVVLHNRCGTKKLDYKVTVRK